MRVPTSSSIRGRERESLVGEEPGWGRSGALADRRGHAHHVDAVALLGGRHEHGSSAWQWGHHDAQTIKTVGVPIVVQ